MNTKEALVKRIEMICKEKGISAYRLSLESGVAPSTVFHILNGTSQNPGIITIARLCNGMGISLCDFFSWEHFDELEAEDE